MEREVILNLQKDNTPAQAAAVKEALSRPESFTPAVLYALSRALFIAGRKDEAAVWFYSAQVRARFDARRTTDLSARQAVTILNDMFGAPINIYAFQSPSRVRKYALQAVAWDRAAPHDYNHAWMYPHGLGVYDPATPKESEWEALAEDTRVTYVAQMEEALIKGYAPLSESDPRAQFELNVPRAERAAPQEEEEENDSVYSNIGG